MCSAPLTELRALWSPAGRGARRVDPDQTVLSTRLVKLAPSGVCSYGKPKGDRWATPLPHHISLCSRELTVIPSDWRKKGSCSLCPSPSRPRYGSQVTTNPYTVTFYDGRAKRTRAALQQALYLCDSGSSGRLSWTYSRSRAMPQEIWILLTNLPLAWAKVLFHH